MARVLLVEDAEVIRTSVGIALEEAGFSVETRADGETFERDLAEYRPDLVLLDVMLPGRDGFELLSVAREISNAGIVLVTARDGVQDRLHGLRTGADDYVVKPFVLAELIAQREVGGGDADGQTGHASSPDPSSPSSPSLAPSSTSSRLRTLPVELRGSSSRNTISRGTL